jgi:putative hydrolase of the HAD superfamily
MNATTVINAVLFDYGGVLAEEGFQNGLYALARRYGLDPEELFAAAAEAVYASGYVTGRGSEAEFWSRLSARTGLPPYRPVFTTEILDRFVLRPSLLQAVDRLRRAGYQLAILSDQTDWLDRLNRRDAFFDHFDQVFNSYHLGKGKRDAALFLDVAARLQLPPERLLFIDDNPGHVERAARVGLKVHLFVDQASCLEFLQQQTGLTFPA